MADAYERAIESHRLENYVPYSDSLTTGCSTHSLALTPEASPHRESNRRTREGSATWRITGIDQTCRGWRCGSANRARGPAVVEVRGRAGRCLRSEKMTYGPERIVATTRNASVQRLTRPTARCEVLACLGQPRGCLPGPRLCGNGGRSFPPPMIRASKAVAGTRRSPGCIAPSDPNRLRRARSDAEVLPDLLPNPLQPMMVGMLRDLRPAEPSTSAGTIWDGQGRRGRVRQIVRSGS